MSLDGPMLDASYFRPKPFVSPIIPTQEPSITKKLTNELQERIVFITTDKCTIVYHNSISIYNINPYMFRHFYVIIREFYILALLSYINS